jgi:hypothetical protein
MMKKLFLVSCFLVIAIQVFAQNNAAVVREIFGEVEVKRPSDQSWVPAKQNMSLDKNTLISTGFRSTARIALGNSVLTVRPLSRLSLEELSAERETETTTLYLQAGRVRANVSPPAGGRTVFQVKSPSATASVRGTSFNFDSMNLQVNSGTVAFAGNDGVQRMITGGKSSYVSASGQTLSFAEAEQQTLKPPIPQGASSDPVRQGSSPANNARYGSVDVDLGWYNK